MTWATTRTTTAPETDQHAARVVRHVADLGIAPVEGTRGWTHMGAVICDAALQPRCTYRTVVLPRIRSLLAEWPDADTVSRFAGRLTTSDLGQALDWRGPVKLRVVREMTVVLGESGVETVEDLREAMASPDGDLRRALRRVRRVGPKTVDYLAILAGSADDVAVDVHMQAFLRAAGVPAGDYHHDAAVLRASARLMGCSPGALDGAVWRYSSDRVTRVSRRRSLV